MEWYTGAEYTNRDKKDKYESLNESSPSDSEFSWTSAASEDNFLEEKKKKKKKKKKKRRKNEAGKSGEEEKIIVKAVLKTDDGKRVYDKKQCCSYCNKLVVKFTRHLRMKHMNESEVARLMAKSVKDEDGKVNLELSLIHI